MSKTEKTEIVYLQELDPARASYAEVVYGQWRLFDEIAVHGRCVAVTMEQLTRSRVFLNVLWSSNQFHVFLKLIDQGKILVTRPRGDAEKPHPDTAAEYVKKAAVRAMNVQADWDDPDGWIRYVFPVPVTNSFLAAIRDSMEEESPEPLERFFSSSPDMRQEGLREIRNYVRRYVRLMLSVSRQTIAYLPEVFNEEYSLSSVLARYCANTRQTDELLKQIIREYAQVAYVQEDMEHMKSILGELDQIRSSWMIYGYRSDQINDRFAWDKILLRNYEENGSPADRHRKQLAEAVLDTCFNISVSQSVHDAQPVCIQDPDSENGKAGQSGQRKQYVDISKKDFLLLLLQTLDDYHKYNHSYYTGDQIERSEINNNLPQWRTALRILKHAGESPLRNLGETGMKRLRGLLESAQDNRRTTGSNMDREQGDMKALLILISGLLNIGKVLIRLVIWIFSGIGWIGRWIAGFFRTSRKIRASLAGLAEDGNSVEFSDAGSADSVSEPKKTDQHDFAWQSMARGTGRRVFSLIVYSIIFVAMMQGISGQDTVSNFHIFWRLFAFGAVAFLFCWVWKLPDILDSTAGLLIALYDIAMMQFARHRIRRGFIYVMGKEWADYLVLASERPEEFGKLSSSDGGKKDSEIVLDPLLVQEYEMKTGKKIGIMYRSPWNIMVVDLVRRNGRLKAVERILPAVQKESAVVIPILEGRFVLFREYRHTIRDNQYAFPRVTLEKSETARNRLWERFSMELDAQLQEVHSYGSIIADSGLSGGRVSVYCCRFGGSRQISWLDGAEEELRQEKQQKEDQKRRKKEEADEITILGQSRMDNATFSDVDGMDDFQKEENRLLLTRPELDAWIEGGRIFDGVTLAAYGLFEVRNHPEFLQKPEDETPEYMEAASVHPSESDAHFDDQTVVFEEFATETDVPEGAEDETPEQRAEHRRAVEADQAAAEEGSGQDSPGDGTQEEETKGQKGRRHRRKGGRRRRKAAEQEQQEEELEHYIEDIASGIYQRNGVSPSSDDAGQAGQLSEKTEDQANAPEADADVVDAEPAPQESVADATARFAKTISGMTQSEDFKSQDSSDSKEDENAPEKIKAAEKPAKVNDPSDVVRSESEHDLTQDLPVDEDVFQPKERKNRRNRIKKDKRRRRRKKNN